MFIPTFIIVCVIIWFVFFRVSNADVANALILEMRDPGGLKRQAFLDAKAADKAARKAARGPAGAIIGGILALGALVGLIGLIWGGFALLCIAVGIVVTLVLSGIVVAANKLGLRLGYTILGLMLIPFTIEGIKCLITVLK